jgi:hypothetical protein
MTIVFPVIKAPILIPTKIAAGKLNGEITPQTPYGFITLLLFSFGYALLVWTINPLFFYICSE